MLCGDGNSMTQTWTTERDHHSPSGVRHVMRDPSATPSPLVADDRIAVCAYMGERTWEASFYTQDYRSINETGATATAAIRRLCERMQWKVPTL